MIDPRQFDLNYYPPHLLCLSFLNNNNLLADILMHHLYSYRDPYKKLILLPIALLPLLLIIAITIILL